MSVNPLMIDLPPQLRGERVIVRPYRPGDGKRLFEAIDESREHLLPWLPFAPEHTSVEASEAIARRLTVNWVTRSDLTMGMWDITDTHYLGGTGLHRINWEAGAFEIGYWIRKSAEGKGLVTESVRLLTSFVFEELKGNRVSITCADGNDRSRAIPEKLGFTYEGMLRNFVKTADGVVRGLHVYAMVPEEYAVAKIGW